MVATKFCHDLLQSWQALPKTNFSRASPESVVGPCYRGEPAAKLAAGRLQPSVQMSKDGEDVPEAEPAEGEESSDGFPALLQEFLDSKTWTTVVMTATFFALFQADICTMYFGKRADLPFAYLTLGWFVVFLFEMAMNFIMGIDYGANPGIKKLTFYFFLDLVGTLSLIPDFVVIFGITFPSSGSAMLARVARTARVGEHSWHF